MRSAGALIKRLVAGAIKPNANSILLNYIFKYKLPRQIRLYKYRFISNHGQIPVRWYFIGSNDNITWTEIPGASQVGSNASDYVYPGGIYTRTLTTPSDPFQYFAMVVTHISHYISSVYIDDFRFFGT